jgi:hypothetical protein
VFALQDAGALQSAHHRVLIATRLRFNHSVDREQRISSPLALDCMGNSPNNQNRGNRMRHWEIIADNLSKAGFSWGCSSEIDVTTGRVLFTADANRNDGKRFTVIADDKLAAFLELERVTRESLRFPMPK